MHKVWRTAGLTSLALLCVPAGASAAPAVTAKARILPVPKHLNKRHSSSWQHTGDILGAPAALELEAHISGHEYPTPSEYPGLPEYEYAPPPLRRVTVELPKGTKIQPKGFPVCSVTHFERQDPEGCPTGSLASPPGEARGVVSFGSTHVHEKVKVQAYFAPGGGLTFYVEGRSPAAIETFASGTLTTIKEGPFSKRLTSQVPLIETVTGAPAASAEYIDVTVGAIIKKHKRLISYGTVPKRCPKGGFPGKGQLWFGSGAEPSWSSTTVRVKVPCPKR